MLTCIAEDGFYVEEETQPEDGPKQKQRVIKKIPEAVIRNAKGLAIFTTMRTGLWISGAGGSGVLVAKKPDGTWSEPSGIMLHTAGLGFLVGIDIYDCVLVLNTDEAVEAFTKVRCTLGGEVSVVAGPVGVGGILETEVHKRQSPIFTYMKSRGFYAGVQIDGTIVIERMDENERFYGEELPVKEILAGKVRHPPHELKRLMETIKAAQGDTEYDETLIPDEPPPGDYEIDDGNMFGVPDKEDPDPYGVLALEKEGMSLREAGTQQRASWEQFSFNPAPTSPIHSMYARSSNDGGSRTISNRNSWRNTLNSESKASSSLRNSMEVRSMTSARSLKSPVADSSTQTDFADDLPSPQGRTSPQGRRSSKRSSQQSAGSGSNLPHSIPENEVLNSKQDQASIGAAEPIKVYEEPLPIVEGSGDLGEQAINSTKEPASSPIEPTRSSEEKTPDRMEPISVSTNNGYSTPPVTPPLEGNTPKDIRRSLDLSDTDDADADVEDADEFSDDEYDDEDLQIIEEPVVHSIQTMQMQPQTSQAFPGAARVVTVPKRLPPKLPERNPNRGRASKSVVVDSSPPVDAGSFDAFVPDASPTLADQDLEASKPTKLASESNSTGVEDVEQSLDSGDHQTPQIDAKVSSPSGVDATEDQKLESAVDGIKLEDHESASVQDVRKEQQSPESIPKVPGGFD